MFEEINIFVLMELKDIGHWRIVLPERVVTLGDDHILQSSISHHETLAFDVFIFVVKVVDKNSLFSSAEIKDYFPVMTPDTVPWLFTKL